MKKIILVFTLVVSCLNINAQCVPDPLYTTSGIYPDSATGLPAGIVGQAYNEVITIITPLDTVVTYLGTTLSVTIVSVTLDSVNGLPNNITYDCAVQNCVFPGGSTSCAVLYSTTNPTAADVGVYPIMIYTTSVVNAGTWGTLPVNDSIDYYYVEIKNNVTSVVNYFDDLTFELKGAFPNPANDKTRIQFISGSLKKIEFTVYNVLGEQMEHRLISANRGVNEIELLTSGYSEGIYFYAINNGDDIISKRMIVVR